MKMEPYQIVTRARRGLPPLNRRRNTKRYRDQVFAACAVFWCAVALLVIWGFSRAM